MGWGKKIMDFFKGNPDEEPFARKQHALRIRKGCEQRGVSSPYLKALDGPIGKNGRGGKDGSPSSNGIFAFVHGPLPNRQTRRLMEKGQRYGNNRKKKGTSRFAQTSRRGDRFGNFTAAILAECGYPNGYVTSNSRA